MFIGILHKASSAKASGNDISEILQSAGGKEKTEVVANRNFVVGYAGGSLPTLDRNAHIWQEGDKSGLVFFRGNVFNKDEFDGFKRDGQPAGKILADRFNKVGINLFDEINGNYVLSIWNPDEQKLTLARDHLGVEPLYIFENDEIIAFASSIDLLLKIPEIKPELDFEAIYRYLLFNYNPGQNTFVRGVKKLRHGFYFQYKNGRSTTERFWYLSFKNGSPQAEEKYKEELLPLMQKAVKLRVEEADSHGAFLSGGMDSSSVVGLMSSEVRGNIHTFSFRCKGKSFDESHYAKIVSDRYGTNHHLVEYDAEEVLRIGEIVELMDEPFCDIGIEVASYILGREAADKTSYVLTGDGGDELFAGHPVYQADKVAQKFSRLPVPLQQMITSIFKLFPDTEKKKSFAVKAQRFAYSYQFPKELFSNRWRIYYTDKELKNLLQGDYHEALENTDALSEIISYYQEADGEDFLSKTLYGDYHTVVSFYLRRMQLLRKFGIEGRFPMFDPRLVEYAAKIPSELKLRGSETKYILHKTMTGVLPDEIVFRKDKLGHSVPFKNWLRENDRIKEFITDVLSEEAVRQRGLFNYNFVSNLLEEHFRRSKNNSHRIWALLVLELWMQKHLD